MLEGWGMMRADRSGLLVLGLLLVQADMACGEMILGRLFLSPEERMQLEAQRHAGDVFGPDLVDEAQAAGPADSPVPSDPVIVNGYVARSGRLGTVWLNARMRHGTRTGERAFDAVLEGSTRLRMRLADGSTIGVRVGQSVDLYTGEIVDVLERAHGPAVGAGSGAPEVP